MRISAFSAQGCEVRILRPFCVSMNGDAAFPMHVIHNLFESHSPVMINGDRRYDGALGVLYRIQPRRLGNGHIIFSTQNVRQGDCEEAGPIQAYGRHRMRLLKGLRIA
jgi:hypothetical protein